MMSDTICGTDEMKEATLIEMLDNNLLPRFKTIKTSTIEDIERFRKECEAGADVVVFRIPRDVAEGGASSGAAYGRFLVEVTPEKAFGSVVLSFDGWADDPRELFQVDEVVSFCRGALFLDLASPDRDHTKKLLRILLDEHSFAFENGELVDQRALDAAGSVWLCSTCFRDEVFSRGKESPSGWMRDYGLSFGIREWLCGRASSPSGA
jgi:hypothetical protein